MAFTTIQPTPGLDESERRRGNRHGPPNCAVRTSYQSMLATACFTDVEFIDWSREYGETQGRWIEAADRYEAGMREALGDEVYDERITMRLRTKRLIDEGVLSRWMFTAVRP